MGSPKNRSQLWASCLRWARCHSAVTIAGAQPAPTAHPIQKNGRTELRSTAGIHPDGGTQRGTRTHTRRIGPAVSAAPSGGATPVSPLTAPDRAPAEPGWGRSPRVPAQLSGQLHDARPHPTAAFCCSHRRYSRPEQELSCRDVVSGAAKAGRPLLHLDGAALRCVCKNDFLQGRLRVLSDAQITRVSCKTAGSGVP